MAQLARNLLIVDDNEGICKLLFELFSDEGYDVETAQSGMEALRCVKARVPSLIILDMKMPGMSGIEALHEIRKINLQVPVIVMTAYAELDTIIETKESGLVQHYLSKPFDLNELCFLVKEVLFENVCCQKISS